jgi:hypothetical protein
VFGHDSNVSIRIYVYDMYKRCVSNIAKDIPVFFVLWPIKWFHKHSHYIKLDSGVMSTFGVRYERRLQSS